MRNSPTLTALAILAGALAACSEPAGPEPRVPRAGVLQLMNYEETSFESAEDDNVHWTVEPDTGVLVSPQVLVAPDTVEAGTPFEVTVGTIGPNGCWSAESQEVNVADGMVELKPFDVHSGAGACTELLLLYLSHTSTITLDVAGEWVVRVTGRRVRHGDEVWEEPVSAEKVVVVR